MLYSKLRPRKVMNTLSDILDKRYVQLGDTAAGSAWAMMALHPSGGPLELRGIPDADAFPCVCMDYESVVSVPPLSNSTTAWKCIINLLAHPVQPVSYRLVSAGGQFAYGGVVNPTLPLVSVYSDLTVGFSAICNSYRMLYCGITVDLDASSLNDSGSVVAGQFPLEVQRFNYGVPKTGACVATAHIMNTNYATNFPDQAISQLPGAYMGLAKDGIYMPLKIDPEAPWVSTNSADLVNTSNPTVASTTTLASLRSVTLSPVATGPGTAFPFYGSPAYGVAQPLLPCYTIADFTTVGDVVTPLQQTNMGHIVFYNLNAAASLTLKVRWGLEMRVEPTSLLAPALKPSARHDAKALSAYSDVAGSLPWAYPSCYNSEGKVLGVIKQVWNNLKPIAAAGLGLVPHPAAKAGSMLLQTLPSFERPSGTGSTVVKSSVKGPTRPKPKKRT